MSEKEKDELREELIKDIAPDKQDEISDTSGEGLNDTSAEAMTEAGEDSIPAEVTEPEPSEKSDEATQADEETEADEASAEDAEKITSGADGAEPKKRSFGKKKKEKDEDPADVRARLEHTAHYKQEDLEKELEDLASLFRQELKKAKMDDSELSEQTGVLIQQLDETEDGAKTKEETIPEDELCLCCGERRRDKSVNENYEYCTVCREAMRHYPLGLQHLFLTVAIVAAVVFGIITFVNEFGAYYNVYLARQNTAQNKLTSAVKAYDSAISEFEAKDIVAKKCYFDSALLQYGIMSGGATTMNDVSSRIEKAVSKAESKLVFYNKYVGLRYEVLKMSNTLQAFYSLVDSDDYASFDMKTGDTYDEMQKKLSDLLEQTMTVTPIGGTTADYSMRYDEGIVYFSKYMLAYACSDYTNAYTYLEKVAEVAPDYVWLYGYELSTVRIQKGRFKEAMNLADKLIALNADDNSGYILNTYALRMQKEYDEALKVCAAGMKTGEENPDLYRQQAIVYLLKGDSKNAKIAIEKAAELSQYGVLYETYLVIGTELKDDDMVKTAEEGLATLEVTKSERVKDYLDGTLTALQLFTEDTGEVEG